MMMRAVVQREGFKSAPPLKITHVAIQNETELVKACLVKDRQAQRMLFDKYKDAMYTILYRMLRNEEEAADALQEGFIQVFRGLEKFRGSSTLGAWIKTIIVRAGIARQRQGQRTVAFDQTPLERLREDQQPNSWDENLTGEYLDKAIAQLSEGYRNVFLLIEVEGYSHKETATMLGITEGTSKSQLHHAKKILQKKLKDLNNY